MTKNMVYKGKTSSYKARRAILLTGLVLTLTLFMVSFVSSAEFDNVKGDLVINETTSKYGKISIKNWFGLTDLADLELKVNTDTCSISCSAELEIKTYDDDLPLIDSVAFFTINPDGSRTEQNIRSYKFYISIKDKQIDVPDYGQVCKDIFVPATYNSTEFTYESCTQVQKGTHKEDAPDWTPYILGTTMPSGTYKVKLEGEKKANREVDWIIKSQGKDLNEWALWEAEDAPVAYYRLDETSGSVVIDALGLSNGTNLGASQGFAGKIGTGYSFQPNWLGYGINISSATPLATSTVDGVLSFNFWAYRNETPSTYTEVVIGAYTPLVNGWDLYFYSTSPHEITFGKNGINEIRSPVEADLNVWTMISVVTNGVNVTFYKNGIFNYSAPYTTTSFDLDEIRIGTGNDRSFIGTLDEIGVWNRSISQEEITELYNDGAGTPFGGGFEVTLNSPEDNYISPSSEVTFNCSVKAETGTTISNISLWTNSTGTWARDQINISLGGSNTTIFNLTFAGEDNYLWTCSATDSDNDEGFASSNRTFSVDTTPPVINITNPYELINYGYTNKPFNFNWTVSDDNLNSCWYTYNDTATNTTVTCSDNGIAITLGNYTDRSITLWANDSILNENNSTNTWVYTLWENNKSNVSSAVETTTQYFIVNATYDSSTYIGLVTNLIYNDTEYLATNLGSGDNAYYNRSLVIPTVSTETNYTYYWSFNFNDGSDITQVNTTYQKITVSAIVAINITSGVCPTEFGEAINYTFADARNLTVQTADIDYNYEYGLGSANSKSIFGSLTGASVFRVCYNQTIGSEYRLGYGEIVYVNDGYSQRTFFEFTNQTLDNITDEKTLYMLTTGKSTSFLFDFISTNLKDYTGYYARLLRWYPELDQYNVVETGKTDDKGETIMRVEVEDADYRVGLYQVDGTLVKLLNPVRFACLSAPCSYTVTISTSDDDYTSFMGVDVSLIFNETNGIWTYTWNDPSSNTDSMTLLVTKETGTRSITICNSNSTGTTGVMTCDSSSYSGTIKAVGFRTASPATAIIMKIINTVSTAFRSTTGLFVAMIIFLALMLIGVVSPLVSVILGILALFPAMLFGSINYSIFIGIAVIGGIVIHFAKRTSG